jgi:hypothetical protein
MGSDNIDELDIYRLKNTQEQEFSNFISQISAEEKIFYISEKISNKNLFLLYCQIFLDLFSFKWIFQDYEFIFLTILFLAIFIIIGGTAESFLKAARMDYFIVFTEGKVIKIQFFKKRNPVLEEAPFTAIQYYTIQKRFLRKNFDLIFYTLGFEKIHKRKFKRIKNPLLIQKYLDSLLFYFGKFGEHSFLKTSFKLPMVLNISEKEYKKIITRLKHIYIYFIVSTFILILIGVFLALFIPDIIYKLAALISFGILGAIVFGVLGEILMIVWHELSRHSSVDDQLVITNEEIRNNGSVFPLSQGIMLSAVYLNSRNTTQTPQKPKPSIYCFEIKEIQNLNNIKHFGPVDNFQNWFNRLYSFLLKWKHENDCLFSKEQLYQNTK